MVSKIDIDDISILNLGSCAFLKDSSTLFDHSHSLNVSSPTEPMALRLSSQLLYGVVRIHMQQVSGSSRSQVGLENPNLTIDGFTSFLSHRPNFG